MCIIVKIQAATGRYLCRSATFKPWSEILQKFAER